MNSIDTYLDLCTQFYEVSKPEPSPDEYAFYRSYARDANTILEPMCGTGRFLLPLVSDGFNVEGFDASLHMLNALHEKAKQKNFKITVWQGLVEDLKLTKKYQLIFIPSGSLGLITDLKKVKHILKIFYQILEDKGKFVFEAETLKGIPEPVGIWRGSAWQTTDGKTLLGSFLTLPAENSIVNVMCRYELIGNNSIVKTEMERIEIRLYEPKNLHNLLAEIGFTNIRMLKAYDRSKLVDKDAETIIYECTK